MLFVIFVLSVVTLELIKRYDAKSGSEKSRATPAPAAALAGDTAPLDETATLNDTATMDLVRLARALAGDGVRPLPEPELPSSSNSAVSPQEAAGRSSSD
jgi:hypothetical protein